VLPSFIAPAVQLPNASQNARKWRRSYVDGPEALPYKPRQSRPIAAASRAPENIPWNGLINRANWCASGATVFATAWRARAAARF